MYLLVFAVCSISPYDRDLWAIENLPSVILVLFLVLISRYYEFSKTSYALMLVFPLLQTIGAHFTFEKVPFDFVTEILGFERNHFDRITHFTVGFYAYPIAESLFVKQMVSSRVLASFFSVCIIFAIANFFEILEWWYAVLVLVPGADNSVLGWQGDRWDAQKDMLADGMGALFVSMYFLLKNRASSSFGYRPPD